MKIKKFFYSLFILSSLVGFSCSKENSVSAAEDAASFSVVSFAPDGVIPKNVKYPSIQVVFSEPIVSLEKLGEPIENCDVFEIEPKINGVYRWYGTSVLSFECSDKIIPQKTYRVRVNKNLKSVKGGVISGNTDFSFSSWPLEFERILPCYEAIEKNIYIDSSEMPAKYARKIALYFSAPVNKSEIKKYIRVDAIDKSKNKTTLDFDITDAKDNVVKIDVPSLNDGVEVSVVLSKGAQSDVDCVKTEKEQSHEFSTLTELKVDHANTSMSGWGEYSHPVRITFNHPIENNEKNTKLVASLLKTVPEKSITEKNVKIEGRSILVHSLGFDYENKYTLSLASGLVDAYGIKMNSSKSFEVTVPKARSYVSFKDYGFKMLESQFVPKIAFRHQNIITPSFYTVSSICGISKKYKNNNVINVSYNEQDKIPKNRSVTEIVELKDLLEKIDGQYRGSVKFNAEFQSLYRWTTWQGKEKEELRENENTLYLQVTDLACTVRQAYDKVVVLATNISSGLPVKNADVAVYGFDSSNSEDWEILNGSSSVIKIGSGKTNSDGLAAVFLSGYENVEGSKVYVEVKTDTDHIYYPVNSWTRHAYSSSWNSDSPKSAMKDIRRTFFYTDRGLYKPGETISFSGIDKTFREGKFTTQEGDAVVLIYKSNSRDCDLINVKVSKNGSFSGKWKIPSKIEPGTYNIKFAGPGDGTYRYVGEYQIQFFERLKFESSTSIMNDTNHFAGDTLHANLTANYLGGGSLGGSSYSSYWTREPRSFAVDLPALDNYVFGPSMVYDSASFVSSKKGTLDMDGKASVSQTTGDEKLKGMPYLYKTESTVTDSSNQMISSSASVLVHPAKYYLGVSQIKNSGGFPKKGDTVKFDLVGVTPEGNAPSASDVMNKSKVKVELLVEEWNTVQQVGVAGEIHTRYERNIVTEKEYDLEYTPSLTPKEISVSPKKGGSYILRVSSEDVLGREVITEKRFYVLSSDWSWFDRDNSEEIKLTADKKIYKNGETANILLNSPLPKGRYLVTIEREKIFDSYVLELDSSATQIPVKITADYCPQVFVTVSSYTVRTGKPVESFAETDLDKPKGIFGYVQLFVDKKEKAFDIAIKSSKENYRPGEEAELELTVTKNGKPYAGSEITLMAVDRGVIDLIDYHVPDPVEYFYNDYLFCDRVCGGDSRSLLIDPVTYEIRDNFGGDMLNESSQLKSMAAREDGSDDKGSSRRNFDPTAVFVPAVVTDSNGKAKVKFKLPDSLTEYRVTAVGVKDSFFSLNEDKIKVTNPVSVREVTPGKLRINDVSEAGVVITNMTDVSQSVTVSLSLFEGAEKAGYKAAEDDLVRLPGKALVKGSSKQTVSVPANSTRTLMFEIEAKNEGWISLEYTVSSDPVKERLYGTLEIERPYVFETVSTVEEIRDNGKSKNKIKIPSTVNDSMGNLTVVLDATRLGALKDSVSYVFNYPYGCLEQRSSRILPLVAFGEYIKILDLESRVKNPKKVIRREMDSWAKYQLSSGGFPYWPGSTYDSFYVSCRIAEIIAIAREKKIYSNSDINVGSLASYISKEVNSYKNSAGKIDSMTAYGYYVLSRLGEAVPVSDLDSVMADTNASLTAKLYTGLTYANCGHMDKAAECAKIIKTMMALTTRSVDFTCEEKYSWYHNSSDDYSLALMLFEMIDPADTYNSHLVYKILSLRKSRGGYWSSTVSTARVLIAMDLFIRKNDLKNTDFTAEVLIDGKNLASGTFKGLAADAVTVSRSFAETPVLTIKKDTEVSFDITKKGDGVLYASTTMKYPIPVTEQKPRDEGICVYTMIYDAQTNERVTEDNLVAGNIYRQEVFVSSTRSREFLALRVPLPSGAQVMNAAFATTQDLDKYGSKSDEEDDDDDYSYMYSLSNQKIYDNEVQYFWNNFETGMRKVEFIFRAVRKGTFQTPSVQAECMYEPEVFGRSSGKVWTIK